MTNLMVFTIAFLVASLFGQGIYVFRAAEVVDAISDPSEPLWIRTLATVLPVTWIVGYGAVIYWFATGAITL